MAEVQRCFLPASQSHGLSMKGCRSTVRTLRSASFKHKNNTLRLCSQQLKNKFWKIEQLHKILFVEKKNTAHAAQR